MIVADFVFVVLTNPWRFVKRYSNRMTPIIIPADSKIVFACKHGQLNVVRKLFQNKQASVWDITSDNYSLLFVSIRRSVAPIAALKLHLQFAIDGNHAELVRFLLDQGADPNFTFGVNQT
jgi:hypothetical protein